MDDRNDRESWRLETELIDCFRHVRHVRFVRKVRNRKVGFGGALEGGAAKIVMLQAHL